MNQSHHFFKPMQIAIIGGDMRQYYLANYFAKIGHRVTCYQVPFPSFFENSNTTTSTQNLSFLEANSLEEALSQNTMIIGPVPFSKDQKSLCGSSECNILLSDLHALLGQSHFLFGGNISASTIALCSEKKVPYYDFMKSESLTYLNAELTAEGVLCEILKNTPFMLQDASALILGYGKCGTILAHKLNMLGCKISVSDSSSTRMALATSFGFLPISSTLSKEQLSEHQIIINTVPSLLLTEERISKLSSDCYLFDIASAPGGIDMEATKKHHIPAFYCPGLPGKIAPLTAGELIGTDILAYLKNYFAPT